MKKTKTERGQSLVELAISLVILLFLLSGIVEFGMAFFQFVQLRDAAQEGALYGSTEPADFTAIETRVRSSSNTPINLDAAAPNPVKVIISVNDVPVWIDGTSQGVDTTHTACEANALKVRTEFDHYIFMPFMPKILGRDKIRLNAEVTDTILRPVCPPP